ncbi:MAG TPA: Spo0B domain-containing protein [Thermaerobacter sp.]
MCKRDEPGAELGDAGYGDADRLVRVVRAWRHGAVNRLQVALGWLQMGRPERAAETLGRWCRQLQWEGAALRQWPPEAAALYLIWRARCEEAGLDVTWHPPIRPPSVPAALAPADPGARGSPPEPDPGIVGQLAAALEAAWEAGRSAPGSPIWLRWDGSAGMLRWGLEEASGAAGPR